MNGLLLRRPGVRARGSRALGLALGVALDRALADPRRGHPVAGFGRLASALERRTYADDRRAGALHTGALVGAAAGVGALAEHLTRHSTAGRTVVVALGTWTVLGGTSLSREAHAVGAHLTRDDLPAARHQVRSLVGRDPSRLDAADLSRAAIESVAENTSDAVVAPLLLGAVAGTPGLLAYRAANTLDAMIGHRSERYRHFGWAAARLDDVLNLPGARLSGALAAAGARTVGGRPADAIRAWRRDARKHPSPNAGVVEAAFAGALGVRLGGTTPYPYGVEERPSLGEGRAPTVEDLPRAIRLADVVGLAATGVAVAIALSAGRAPRPRPRRPH